MFQITFESAFPLRMNPGWMSSPHAHPLHELFYVSSGLMETVNGGDSAFCSQNQFQLQPAGVEHQRGNSGETFADTLALRWEGLDARLPGEPVVIEDSRGYLAHLLRRMCDLHPAQSVRAGETLDIVTQAALYEITFLLEESSRRLTSRIRSFILSRLAENLSLPILAEAVGLSPSHFSRQFKEETGLTPMAYVRQLRAGAAVQLLRHTSLKLHAVARNVGFVDASHLSRAVREFHHVTPGAIREAFLTHTPVGE